MNLRTSIRATAALLALTLALAYGPLTPGARTAYAQATDGRLLVTVKDPSGAVIPNATITVTNQGTGTEVAGSTSDSGLYTGAQLPVGLYTVRVEAPGFQTGVRQDVKIDVGKDYSLVVDLTVGTAGDVVTITAGEDLVQTTNAEVTNTVTKKQIDQLPLDGRDPLQLIQLQAGVSLDNGRGGVAINGQRTSSATVTQDGITIQDYAIRTNALTFSPNRTVVSQVAEFSVTTQNAGADTAGSSAIKLVTPQGTNEFHGEVYEFHRNDALGANDFFSNEAGLERTQLIRNQFGFAIGGPVFVPKVYNGRDKFFFFGSYEGFRERSSGNTTTTVFTPGARNGFFTYREGGTGALRTVNVLQLQGANIDPTIAALLNRIPLPNSDLAGDGLNTAGFTFNKRAPSNRNQGAVRLDYELSDRHHLEGVYQYTGEKNRRNDIDGTFNLLPLVYDQDITHFAVGAWTWNITDSLTNELRAGVNNSDTAFVSEEDTSLGFFAIFPLTNDPQVNFDPQSRRTIVSSLIDNASYTWRDHLFRFGTRLDRVNLRGKVSFAVTPRVTLGVNTATPGSATLSASDFPTAITPGDLATANALLASLAGYIANVSREFNVQSSTDPQFRAEPQVRDYVLNEYAVYGQDQWRLREGLTLNVGLRWDYTTPLRETENLGLLPTGAQGQESVLDPNGEFNFVNGFFFHPDKNNFAPNVGIAWDVFGDGKTVVRGGFSQAYVNDETIRATQIVVETNPGLTTTLDTGDIFGGSLSTGLPAVLNGDLAPPAVEIPLTYGEAFARNRAGFYLGINPDLQTPHYNQWNVSVEREIGWDTAVSVRYVGNKGYDLLSNINRNQLDVINNGFAADVARAQQNGFLFQAQDPNHRFDPRYNPNIPGSQPLTVFPLLAGGGLLTNSTIQTYISRGAAGTLAAVYFQNDLQGSVMFAPNPNAYFGVLLDNYFTSDYNGLELEVRRRFSKGLGFQANYTWSKSLAYSSGIDQLRQDFPQDIENLSLERRRSLYDVPHNFKANVIYDLPFGSGQRFDPENKFAEKLVSGWQVTSIINWYTGAPISISANRGTFTPNGTTANTSLTADQIKDLFGIYERDGVLYYIDPSVIGPDGRAVAPDGQAPFPGQVFFNPGPGTLGGLQGLQFNGPSVFRWDASLVKRVALTESVNLELRGEMFNVLNHPIFFISSQDINSTSFGRIASQLNDPRVVQLAAKITF